MNCCLGLFALYWMASYLSALVYLIQSLYSCLLFNFCQASISLSLVWLPGAFTPFSTSDLLFLEYFGLRHWVNKYMKFFKIRTELVLIKDYKVMWILRIIFSVRTFQSICFTCSVDCFAFPLTLTFILKKI